MGLDAIHTILFNMHIFYSLILGIWGAVMAARKRLLGMAVRVAGAVLNRSSYRGAGYGYYYSSYYSEGSRKA